MSKDLNPIQKAQSLLNILRSKQRQIDIISGVVLVCTGTLFIFGSILLLEILYPTTTIFRRIYFLSLIILPAISTILVILRIVFSKHLRKGWISDHWWALRIGKISPGKIRDRLLNAIEINRASPTSKDNFSSGLAHAALLNILSEVDDVPVNLALNKTQQRLLLKLFALAMISCIGIFSINPASSLSAIIRIVHPNTEYRIEASVTFTIDPAGGWVYKGEKVVFEVVTSSSFTSEALFNYKYDNGEIQDEIIRFTNNIGTIEFEGFNDPVNYWISYKDYKSNQYRLDIVKRPLVAELNLKLYPPKYTGLPIERGPENTGNAEVLPGTRMELEVFFNKPVESGWCIFSRSNGEKKTSDTLSFETNGIEGNFSTVLMK
nr:hypothetical protein [bacterium]